MLLMLRLLILTVLSSSAVYAASNGDIVAFFKKQFDANPNVSITTLNVRSSFPLHGHEDWNVFILDVKGSVKDKTGDHPFAGQDILFSKDSVVARDLFDINSGKSIKGDISPEFKDSFYKKSNLIYGTKNSKHKIVVFSDPLCPFCIQLVPKLIKDIKDHPKTFALYYYHFPLERIHPASKSLVKCMSAAINKGEKDVVLRTYSAKFDVQETNEKKVLNAFNKALGTNLMIKDIDNKQILDHIEADKDVASDMLVGSTPTVFFDGKKDNSREHYKTVKKID